MVRYRYINRKKDRQIDRHIDEDLWQYSNLFISTEKIDCFVSVSIYSPGSLLKVGAAFCVLLLPRISLQTLVWCIARYSLHLMGKGNSVHPWSTINLKWRLNKKCWSPSQYWVGVRRGIWSLKICHIIYEMTKIIDKLNCTNEIGIFQSQEAAHSRTSATYSPSHATIQ